MYLRTDKCFHASATGSTAPPMVRSLFPTKLYEADIGDDALLRELAHSIRALAQDDEAGRRWSKEHGYAGYTSYASLNDLPKRDPAFAALARALTDHAARFAKESLVSPPAPRWLRPRWRRLTAMFRATA